MNKQQLIFALTNKIAGAEEQIEDFQKEITKSAAYAFTWADSAMVAAAHKEVCKSILSKLESEAFTVDAVKTRALNKMLKAALYPASSTSAVSNLMEIKLAEAWAEIYEMLAD